MGPGKDFQKKNGRRRLNGRNSKPKSDIVMGPTGKMLVTHRAANVPLTKIGYRFQVDTHYGGRHVPLFPTEKSAEIEKGQFLQRIRDRVTKLGVTTRKNQFLSIFSHLFFLKKRPFLHHFLPELENPETVIHSTQ